jgi:hypothetical protein
LRSEELDVIKKFRSFSKVTTPFKRKAASVKDLSTDKMVDVKLRDRISILKQKVKDKTNHSRDLSIGQFKPASKAIRVICEQEVDLSDHQSPVKQQAAIDALTLSGTSNSRIQKVVQQLKL